MLNRSFLIINNFLLKENVDDDSAVLGIWDVMREWLFQA